MWHQLSRALADQKNWKVLCPQCIKSTTHETDEYQQSIKLQQQNINHKDVP